MSSGTQREDANENPPVKEKQPVIFRDTRRYYCKYCGICRSKKPIISSHILTHHKEEMEGESGDAEGITRVKSNTCDECGATFRKPAYLKQHMQSHSLEVYLFMMLVFSGFIFYSSLFQ